ncbi:MAG: beta-ketoacyl synthase N-terminal-like domain-containing protein, partial [Angustibacter sp.]
MSSPIPAPTRATVAAAITGLDIVSPLGVSREEHWAAVLAGSLGLAATASFDSARLDNPISGEIPNLPMDRLPSRLIPATDRMTKISLLAAAGAIADSGADAEAPDGIGVVTAATAGGYTFGQNELQALWGRGPRHVSTHQSYAWFYAVNTGQISIRHGFKGHSGVIVADDAGGLDALAAAQRRLSRGNHTVLAGSVDSAMCPWGRVAQTSTGMTSPVTDPGAAYLPFDRRAQGWVHGEGGAHFVLQATENR